jgi:nicotinamidase-related amidase
MDLPQIPDPVPVAVTPATTALLVLDIQQSNCPRRPDCVASLPTMADFIDRARSAGVLVVYTGRPTEIMPEVAPREGEPFPTSRGPDKFYESDLDDILKGAGITTLLVVGSSAIAAVLRTTAAATQRGYTVAVAEDGISADSEFEVFYARYHMLRGNPENTPLAERAVTLTRMGSVTFGDAA